jgi:hypothetical protein
MYAVLLLLALLVVAPPAHAQWSALVNAGYATGTDNGDYGHGSIAGSLALLRQTRGSFGYGIEAGYYRHESWSRQLTPTFIEYYRRAGWTLSAVLRLRARRGQVRPYGMVGLGYHREVGQDPFSGPGVNGGFGLEIHPGDGSLAMTIGARMHGALHLNKRGDDGTPIGVGFLTLMAGVAIR